MHIKKFTSLLSLYVYAPMKRCLVLLFSMIAAGALYEYLFFAESSGLAQAIRAGSAGRFAETVFRLFGAYGFLVFEVLLFIFLAWNPLVLGNGSYTLMRTGASRSQRYWVNALANFLYLILFWLCKAVSVIVRNDIYIKYKINRPLPGRAYLRIIADEAMIRALPLNNKVVWIAVSVEITVLALIAAGITAKRIDAKTEGEG